MQKKDERIRGLQAATLGAGMALSQMALAGGSGCSVAHSGYCSACGGCVIALAGLSGWALWGSRDKASDPGQDA
ncbi:hypothetical protein [Thiolapillus sp.]